MNIECLKLNANKKQLYYKQEYVILEDGFSVLYKNNEKSIIF